MKCDRKTMLLYAVTDRAWTGEKTLLTQVEEALAGGVTCVQLREKDMPKEQFLEEAESIKRLCHKYGVPFIIDDDVEYEKAMYFAKLKARDDFSFQNKNKVYRHLASKGFDYDIIGRVMGDLFS